MTVTVTVANAPLPVGTNAPTGSGALVLATSPNLVTPNIGVASGTSLDLTGLAEFKSALSAYRWSDSNPSDVAGTLTNGPATAASTLDSDFTSMVNAAGTVTVTFDVAGTYQVSLNGETNHAAAFTFDRLTFVLGGTATRHVGTSHANSGYATQAMGLAVSDVFTVVATAGQTLTVLPTYELTGSGAGANHGFKTAMSVLYCGA